jgi:hypothetical protein
VFPTVVFYGVEIPNPLYPIRRALALRRARKEATQLNKEDAELVGILGLD